MKYTGRLLIMIALFSAEQARAFGVPNQNPVAWMHALPYGQDPGWTEASWLNVFSSISNTWNAPMQATNSFNGKTLTYFADFEQYSVVFTKGFSLNDSWAAEAEVPMAVRTGGFLDSIIERYHSSIGVFGYGRTSYANNEMHYRIQSGAAKTLDGIYNGIPPHIILRLKYWPLKISHPENKAATYGIGLMAQTKQVLSAQVRDQTSGTPDYAFQVNAGIPIGRLGGLWGSASVSLLGENQNFYDWPRNTTLATYATNLEFGVGESSTVFLQYDITSPYMNDHYLKYKPNTPDTYQAQSDRLSSGWNALTSWTGFVSVGYKQLLSGTNYFRIFVTEDYAVGDADGISDFGYVTNAPDIQFSADYHLGF